MILKQIKSLSWTSTERVEFEMSDAEPRQLEDRETFELLLQRRDNSERRIERSGVALNTLWGGMVPPLSEFYLAKGW